MTMWPFSYSSWLYPHQRDKCHHKNMTMLSIVILFQISCLDWTNGINVLRGGYNISIAAEDGHSKSLINARCRLYSTSSLHFCMADPVLDMSSLELEMISKHALDHLEYVEHLDLGNNQLTKVPSRIFLKMENLKTLSLANNSIHRVNINFSGLRKLQRLDLSNNHITVLTNVHLSSLGKHVEIIMDGNKLEFMRIRRNTNKEHSAFSIKFSAPETTTIILMNSPIKISPLRNTFYRAPLYVEVCKVENIIVRSMSLITRNPRPDGCTLEYAGILPNSLNLDYRGMTKFQRKWFNISDNHFSTLILSRNRIKEITPELMNDLPNFITQISLRKNTIITIKSNIINTTSLESLNIDENMISEIEDNAFKNTNLHALSLFGNFLSNLQFTRTLPTSMKELIISFNDISEIIEDFLSNLKNLEYLNLRGNHIVYISADAFRGLHKLRKLDLSSNRLKIIAPGTFHQKSLTELDLRYNSILGLNYESFKNLKNMINLDLSFNKITKITQDSFSGLKNSIITTLNLGFNQIDNIEEGSFVNMTIHTLNLEHNKLSEESIGKNAFKSCTLSVLNLDDNYFEIINGNSFCGIQIYNELSLKNNKIKSIKNGDIKCISCPIDIRLNGMILERIENGAFYDLQGCHNVTIRLDGVKVIQAGIFDDI